MQILIHELCKIGRSVLNQFWCKGYCWIIFYESATINHCHYISNVHKKFKRYPLRTWSDLVFVKYWTIQVVQRALTSLNTRPCERSFVPNFLRWGIWRVGRMMPWQMEAVFVVTLRQGHWRLDTWCARCIPAGCSTPNRNSPSFHLQR